MYDLISGLSLCLEREHGYENKFVSGAFRLVRNTFDNIMKERTAEGVGGGLKGNPFWRNMKKVYGRKVYWGEDSPEKLRKTVFLGGLSLHLNHLIALCAANSD